MTIKTRERYCWLAVVQKTRRDPVWSKQINEHISAFIQIPFDVLEGPTSVTTHLQSFQSRCLKLTPPHSLFSIIVVPQPHEDQRAPVAMNAFSYREVSNLEGSQGCTYYTHSTKSSWKPIWIDKAYVTQINPFSLIATKLDPMNYRKPIRITKIQIVQNHCLKDKINSDPKLLMVWSELYGILPMSTWEA